MAPTPDISIPSGQSMIVPSLTAHLAQAVGTRVDVPAPSAVARPSREEVDLPVTCRLCGLESKSFVSITGNAYSRLLMMDIILPTADRSVRCDICLEALQWRADLRYSACGHLIPSAWEAGALNHLRTKNGGLRYRVPASWVPCSVDSRQTLCEANLRACLLEVMSILRGEGTHHVKLERQLLLFAHELGLYGDTLSAVRLVRAHGSDLEPESSPYQVFEATMRIHVPISRGTLVWAQQRELWPFYAVGVPRRPDTTERSLADLMRQRTDTDDIIRERARRAQEAIQQETLRVAQERLRHRPVGRGYPEVGAVVPGPDREPIGVIIGVDRGRDEGAVGHTMMLPMDGGVPVQIESSLIPRLVDAPVQAPPLSVSAVGQPTRLAPPEGPYVQTGHWAQDHRDMRERIFDRWDASRWHREAVGEFMSAVVVGYYSRGDISSPPQVVQTPGPLKAPPSKETRQDFLERLQRRPRRIIIDAEVE